MATMNDPRVSGRITEANLRAAVLGFVSQYGSIRAAKAEVDFDIENARETLMKAFTSGCLEGSLVDNFGVAVAALTLAQQVLRDTE